MWQYLVDSLSAMVLARRLASFDMPLVRFFHPVLANGVGFHLFIVLPTESTAWSGAAPEESDPDGWGR